MKTVLAVLGVLVAIAAAVLWQMFRPRYTPGALSQRDDLDPIGGSLGGPLSVSPGVTLHSFASGAGPLTLVLHGGPGIPPEAPWPALELLAARRRFVYYHQRGCGRSSRPVDRPQPGRYPAQVAEVEGALGLAQQLADIERIRRLSGGGPIALVGHSFGGFLAALYAAEFPDAVSELVLIAPAALLVMPSPGGDLFAAIRARLGAGERADFDAFLSRYLTFGPALFSRSDDELIALEQEMGAWYRRAVPDMPASAAAKPGGWMVRAVYLSMGRRHDYTAALSAISAPTLIVHGGQDLQPVSVSARYQRAIPGAERVTLEEAGHFPLASHPQALASLLRLRRGW